MAICSCVAWMNLVGVWWVKPYTRGIHEHVANEAWEASIMGAIGRLTKKCIGGRYMTSDENKGALEYTCRPRLLIYNKSAIPCHEADIIADFATTRDRKCRQSGVTVELATKAGDSGMPRRGVPLYI